MAVLSDITTSEVSKPALDLISGALNFWVEAELLDHRGFFGNGCEWTKSH